MKRSLRVLPLLLLGVLFGCDSAETNGPRSAIGTQAPTAAPASVAGGGQPINQLTSACRGTSTAWFRINNDGRAAQLYTWEHLPSGQTGAVHVAANDRAFFQTPLHPNNANVTRLLVNGQEVSRKAVTHQSCWTLSGQVNAVPDGSTDPSAGDGLEDVLVQVFFSGADPDTDTPIYEATTDVDGRYTFSDLPAYTSGSVPFVEYLVVVPETSDGAFNEDLFAFSDPLNNPLTVALPNADVDDADIGFDGDDAAIITEVDEQNASGQREPWSQKDLRKAFDRARKNKPCHNAVLCRDDLLAMTRQIVDDPDDPADPFFGLSFPYLGPDGPDTDEQLLQWGYELSKDAPKGPPDEAARLYSLVFACQINFLGGRGLQNVNLDRAIQAYLEASVAADPPPNLRASPHALSEPEPTAASRAPDEESPEAVARVYLGGGGGGGVVVGRPGSGTAVGR
ncbi:MAG: carboxypeptidase-like regulatory domain-containing protein [Rhodothermales bacterium]|nr:carboxypeptidase-like regulatory domain-containing protein [Rhodothermales bacterium]